MKNISFFAVMILLLAMGTAFAEGNVTPEWRNAGFNDYDASGWMAAGFEKVEEAMAWKNAEFSPGSAALWKKRKISPQDAVKWKEAGLNKSDEADKLAKAGVTPGEYTLWKGKGYNKAKDILVLKADGIKPENAPTK